MKKTARGIGTAFSAVLTAMSVLTLSCVYPTHDDSEYFEEQQSVWQYLSVFSLFQENIPGRGASLSPEAMFAAIGDTLGGARYTGYYFPPAGGGLGPVPMPEPVIKELTASTVYFRFYEFDNRELERFMAFREYMARFDNIIIDLRLNTGGYISVAEGMLSEFIPYNTPYMEYRYREYNERTLRGENMVEIERSVNRNPMLVGKNVAVIVNQWSASASEILVCALKDGANAHILGALTDEILENAIMGGHEFITGERTYGKAIGQVRLTRPGRNMLSITFMEMRGVSERTGSYHRVGIAPDPMPMEYMFECLDIYFNRPDAVDPAVYDLMDSDPDVYFALKTVEPSITSENGAAADLDAERLMRRFLGMRKQARSAEPRLTPNVIGAIAVNNDALFR